MSLAMPHSQCRTVLITGSVKPNFHADRSDDSVLLEGSIYEPMRTEVEREMRAEHFSERMDLNLWVD
jgi:hypothetical protein